MSKVFSLAGIRLGWIATHDKSVIKSCLSHRDYNLVSCGIFMICGLEKSGDGAIIQTKIFLEGFL